MPKINEARAAALYVPGPPGSQEVLFPLLKERRLYVLDRRCEAVEDLVLSVVGRPVLRLHLIHARARPGLGAEVFVADHLASLGSDERERVAVVGAFLQLGCDVIVDGAELDSAWYRDRVRRLGFAAIGPLIESLLTTKTVPCDVMDQWRTDPNISELSLLPTSLDHDYNNARLRIKELVEFEGYTPTQAAARVMVEGYPNAQDRHVWYPKAALDALENGL
jgi:hypothetical protein